MNQSPLGRIHNEEEPSVIPRLGDHYPRFLDLNYLEEGNRFLESKESPSTADSASPNQEREEGEEGIAQYAGVAFVIIIVVVIIAVILLVRWIILKQSKNKVGLARCDSMEMPYEYNAKNKFKEMKEACQDKAGRGLQVTKEQQKRESLKKEEAENQQFAPMIATDNPMIVHQDDKSCDKLKATLARQQEHASQQYSKINKTLATQSHYYLRDVKILDKKKNEDMESNQLVINLDTIARQSFKITKEQMESRNKAKMEINTSTASGGGTPGTLGVPKRTPKLPTSLFKTEEYKQVPADSDRSSRPAPSAVAQPVKTKSAFAYVAKEGQPMTEDQQMTMIMAKMKNSQVATLKELGSIKRHFIE